MTESKQRKEVKKFALINEIRAPLIRDFVCYKYQKTAKQLWRLHCYMIII